MNRWLTRARRASKAGGAAGVLLGGLTIILPNCYGAQVDDCRVLQHHGKQAQAQKCFASLTGSPDPFDRAMGYWGLHRYDQANEQFRAAYQGSRNQARTRTEWGLLFLERFNAGEAVNLFNDALEADPKYAPAYLGLARASAKTFDEKAVGFAKEAISRDPKLYAAYELLAFLALEDGNTEEAMKQAQQALSISSEALDAMSILASIDWLNDKPNSEWIDRILKVNPVYGEAYATGAHFFVINRRYEEGIDYYGKALALNPNLWDARSELGLNLLRVGQVARAKTELEQSYQGGYRNAETVNSLRVIDSLKNYQTIPVSRGVLVLNSKEAKLLQPYVAAELEKSVAIYERKYHMKLPGPVRLEVYPNHEDFIVRTLGLPGQGGLLGVTFGLVVAMDSPSAQAPGQLNWATTIRHEVNHVYVLTATHHRVPRWFAEGLAVHEESATEPEWGHRLTPDVVDAIRHKRLLPVMELERGFVRPHYPSQVVVSYYQAGKLCDYIAQKWGDAALLGMIQSFAAKKPTAAVLDENIHQSPESFDKGFISWLDQQTAKTIEHFDEWKKGMDAAHTALAAGKKDEAVRLASGVRDLYPEYVQGGSAYELLAGVYVDQGKKAEALANLELYRERGGRNVGSLRKLADLEKETGKPDKALDTLRKVNWIYPEDVEVHQKLGELEFQHGDAKAAIQEFQSVLFLQPSDTAQSHYDLARALFAAQRADEARDEVLLSLEAAPDFKPAQQLLLKLSK
jgi:tetratricopeptide (TPR) repeat protein